MYFDEEDLKVWIVKMALTNERLTAAHRYIDTFNKEYKELSADVMLGRLLIHMDELSKAKSYLNQMLSMMEEEILENAAFWVEAGDLHLCM